MLFLLLAIQDVPATAVEAEQAMERAAQAEGQWTAVRRFAAPDAVVLTPRRVPVAEAYSGADPAPAYHWQVASSFVSCDGRIAVNTGPWQREGRYGTFTTVWVHGRSGWQWTLDSGSSSDTPVAAPAAPVVRKAACNPLPRPLTSMASDKKADSAAEPIDFTLIYYPQRIADGSTRLRVFLWNGSEREMVIDDLIADSAQ